jgi:hypothetical protein
MFQPTRPFKCIFCRVTARKLQQNLDMHSGVRRLKTRGGILQNIQLKYLDRLAASWVVHNLLSSYHHRSGGSSDIVILQGWPERRVCGVAV